MKHTDLFNYRSLSEDELARYAKQGYLVLRNVLTQQGIQQMKNEAMEVWKAEKESFDPKKTWLDNSLLVDIHHQSPTVRNYYFEGPLVDIAEQIIGPNVKGATSQLTFKMQGNIKSFGWHQDNGYGQLDPHTALTTLTALDLTNRENGCLWVLPGSHKDEGLRVVQTKEEKGRKSELDVSVDESLALPMEMEAGDCLIFDCWMLHKSDGNFSADRDRRILFLRYADADAVEVYNDRSPRLGRLLRGSTQFEEVRAYEASL